jgi:hypothetical protein
VQRAREGGAAFVILLPLASAAAPVEAPPSFEEQLDFLRSMAR